MAYVHLHQPLGRGGAIARADLVGVRWRRIVALFVDMGLVSVLALAIWLVLVIGTLGAALVFVAAALPYNRIFLQRTPRVWGASGELGTTDDGFGGRHG